MQASNVMKWIVVIAGIIVTLLVFVVERLGSVFHVGISIAGIMSGAFLGIFTMGMITRTANTRVCLRQSNIVSQILNFDRFQGVIIGSIASILFVSIILVGAQYFDVGKAATLPVSTDGCLNNFTEFM